MKFSNKKRQAGAHDIFHSSMSCDSDLPVGDSDLDLDLPVGDSDLDSDLLVGDSDLDSDLPVGDSTTTLVNDNG